jgi:hypothetical protein
MIGTWRSDVKEKVFRSGQAGRPASWTFSHFGTIRAKIVSAHPEEDFP